MMMINWWSNSVKLIKQIPVTKTILQLKFNTKYFFRMIINVNFLLYYHYHYRRRCRQDYDAF